MECTERRASGAPESGSEARADAVRRLPARQFSAAPRSGITRRHHVDPSVIHKASTVAIRRAGLTKPSSAHTCRHALWQSHERYKEEASRSWVRRFILF